jgi:3-dehydroquinate dehydratase
LEAGVDTSVDTSGGGSSGGDDGSSALASEIAALRAEIAASRKFAENVQQTESFQLKKYLADVISGQIVGYGVVGRSYTPGSGVEYAF